MNARLGRVLVVEDDPGNLIKPFGLQELLTRIRAVLRRSKQPGGGSGQMLQHGALAVDLRTHKVTVHGNQIAVTPKEFAILECLASDPGRVVSRQEMLERACDEHWYGPTKVLDVHMAALGTVLLARPTGPLDNEITGLWIILGTISVLALLAAALLAFALARWVSRPLAGLDRAAARLADGDLASRAVVDSGPPELRRLARTFNTMAGRLEALVHGNRAVIADVSHQLRTPLAALRLRLDLLAADTDPDPETTGHELAGALEELARLSRLVDGLLAVARAENVVPVPTAVDVAEVARERAAAWRPVADDRGITLETRSASRAVPAWIGEGHLEQVLDNLIANALEALGAGCHIAVTTTATAAGAQIAVADDGPGMSAEDRERAFLRFTTSNPNGTGLGLAIVHRLATANGGTARLAETPGGGLTAILDFPAGPAPSAGHPESGSAAPPAQDFISL